MLLASVVLGESLNAVQLLGGALVLAGVVVLSVAGPMPLAFGQRLIRRVRWQTR